ncbi:MAG: hypothetical protein PUC88_03030 [Clostridia bacterium]|nr:hypothetical protein [Clostridia bacterium]
MNCYKQQAKTAAAFGLGLLLSCFCPQKFVLALSGIVIIVLACTLRKNH